MAGRPRSRAVAPLVLALMVTLVAAGCAASATPTPTPAPATPTPVPTPATELPDDLCANTGADCALEAGQYLAQQFQPPIGFTLDEGWDNTAYIAGAIQLVHDNETQSIAIVSGPLDGPTGKAEAAGSTAAQFLTYLGTVRGVKVAGRTAVLVGGLPASQVDVTVGKANATLFEVPLTSGTEDPFDLRALETARVIVVDVGTARVVFIIEVFGAAKLADFVTTEVQPFLASVTFPAAP
ncbi:MAG TPA: hypothetical protein VMH24_06925 [Candidatus Sulfotelmatobacter sp.]|nr:hypothetical protein [Candidatus Sulfotelmatobacter sp.]